MFGADVVEMKISKVSPRSKVMKAAFLAAQCVGDGHERIFLRLQHPPAPVSFQVSFFGFLCFFLFSGFVFRFCFFVVTFAGHCQSILCLREEHQHHMSTTNNK